MTTHRILADSPDLLAALARVEILYTDLDGTLLAQGGILLADGDGNPAITCAQAIVDLNRAKLPVIPVSGRSRLQLVEVARMCGWNDFIAEAGALRTYWRNGTRELHFDTAEWPEGLPAQGRTPLEEIRASGALEALLAEFPLCLEHHDPWHLDRDATEVLRGRVDVERAQAILDSLPLPVGIVDNGHIRRASTSLGCEGPLHAYHLVPKGVTKRRSIELDLAERGLTREQAAFIGDSPADLDVAPAVGVSVLVANALAVDGLGEALAAHPNAAVTNERRGDGWAEFARLWLAARG